MISFQISSDNLKDLLGSAQSHVDERSDYVGYAASPESDQDCTVHTDY
ncbi:hypothetical protein H6F89_10235 [Cyanobacteria bacterium FACHB-63]|nr:hypothetical protein [Cyanobacteria bacterium FACHB-63]